MSKQWYIRDSAGMVAVQGDPNSWRDSIGNTFWAIVGDSINKMTWYAPLQGCWKIINGKFVAWRHPHHHHDKTMSRDHFLYLVNAMVEVGDNRSLRTVNKYMTWRISDRHTHTIDSWLWCKGISGSKWALFLWYRVARISQFSSRIWNDYLYRKAPFSVEMPVNLYTSVKIFHTEKQLELREKLYPIYALQNFGWQLQQVPKGRQRRILGRICLRITPFHNYLLQIMFGGTVPEHVVENYQSCTNDRWGVPLNEACDRLIRKLTEEEKGDFDLEKMVLSVVYYKSLIT